MRLLLDGNLPKRLKSDFPEHDIFTVQEKEWDGIKNGELLKRMLDNSFDESASKSNISTTKDTKGKCFAFFLFIPKE